MPRCAHDPCARWRPTWMAPRAIWFDGAFFCSAACLREDATARLKALTPARPVPLVPVRFRLGTLLLAERVITSEVLQTALDRQRHSGRRLGAELLAMGAVDATTLTELLARQAGVSCLHRLSPASVRHLTANLTPSAVAALGVVPFAADGDEVLRVAVAAPLPRMALRTLHRMTGLEVRPYLVADTTLSTLLQAYGAGVCTRRGVRTPSADDAGRWIAEAARAGLADVWRCVPGDSFTWVRLDGTGGIDDIIITETGLEASWQAAPTRH